MSRDERLQMADHRFETFIRERGMRMTTERLEILRIVHTLKGHFDVYELINALEADGFHVSLTTAYTTLRLLYEAGILRKVLFGDRGHLTRFELPDESHVHMVCLHCGRILEAPEGSLVTIPTTKELGGFRASYVAATFYGTCAACARRSRRAARASLHKPDNTD